MPNQNGPQFNWGSPPSEGGEEGDSGPPKDLRERPMTMRLKRAIRYGTSVVIVVTSVSASVQFLCCCPEGSKHTMLSHFSPLPKKHTLSLPPPYSPFQGGATDACACGDSLAVVEKEQGQVPEQVQNRCRGSHVLRSSVEKGSA